MTKLAYLNVGCGNKFHPQWVNIDLVSSSPAVISCNLLNGFPFVEESFDVVYHSQVLEHIPQESVSFFLGECFRVLKKGGILRIVTPDLEDIASEYLKRLHICRTVDTEEGRANYEWIVLELLDQTIRNAPGGQMAKFLKNQSDANTKYAVERIGYIGRELRKTRIERIEKKAASKIWVDRFKRLPIRMRLYLLKMFMTKQEYQAWQIGEFRLGGEIHYWLYDDWSLKNKLEQVGFHNVKKVTPEISAIPDWSKYALDVHADGSAYDPTSLFIEAVK